MIEVNEEWRPVPGFEGSYEVSSFGRFCSLPRTCHTLYGKRRVPGKLWFGNAKAKNGKLGNYLWVGLFREGVKEGWAVQWLVLLAFVGPRPEGMEVCHNDGNPRNNRLDNLRYDTRKGNFADKLKHGTHLRGIRSPLAKLNLQTVQEIRYLEGKMTQEAIAEKFGLSQPYVSKIIRRDRWPTETWGS